jgi:hypothetical protein
MTLKVMYKPEFLEKQKNMIHDGVLVVTFKGKTSLLKFNQVVFKVLLLIVMVIYLCSSQIQISG